MVYLSLDYSLTHGPAFIETTLVRVACDVHDGVG